MSTNKIILTEQQISEIIKLYQQKIKDKEIAKVVNTTPWAVRKTLKGHRRPNNVCKPFPINDVLILNSTYSRSLLRAKIVKSNLIEYKCAICALGGHWNNKILNLQIDHINGIGTDHRIENLRFLCYNCHSQTPTFGAKNIKKKKEYKEPYSPPKYEDYKPNVTFSQKKSPIWNIPKKQLKKIAAKSDTFAKILRYFGFAEKGAQYQALKERLFWEGIDFTHIKLGYGTMRGTKQSRPPKYTADQVLTDNSTFDRGIVKRRILEDKLLNNICYDCGLIPEWNGSPLCLQLHHIDGDKSNNKLDNLIILCPNCHCQTDTYCIGNKNK